MDATTAGTTAKAESRALTKERATAETKATSCVAQSAGKGLLNNNCSDFLRSGFLAKSRRAEEQLASGANWTTTNDELAKKTK